MAWYKQTKDNAEKLRRTEPMEISEAAERGGARVPPSVWLKIGGVGLLLALIYAKVFWGWVVHLWEDENYSFGLLVIPLSLYLAWEKRDQISGEAARPSNLGFLVFVAGVGALLVGSLGAELFVTRLSLLLMITGLILFLRGWNTLRMLALPLVLLLLVIPLPQIVFGQIAFPLQLLASELSEDTLRLLGVPVLREGNVIFLPAITLGVVEACSGLRSIFSLLALALLYGYFFTPSIGERFLLAALSIPIAIGVNLLRIVGTGVLSQFAGPENAEGFFHSFYGWAHFLVALGLLFAAHQVLQQSKRVWRTRVAA